MTVSVGEADISSATSLKHPTFIAETECEIPPGLTRPIIGDIICRTYSSCHKTHEDRDTFLLDKADSTYNADVDMQGSFEYF